MIRYHSNSWLLINRTDPNGALHWLREQLVEAEQLGEKVHLVAHDATGSFTYWAQHFYRLVNRCDDDDDDDNDDDDKISFIAILHQVRKHAGVLGVRPPSHG